jgi:mRNA interferase RelE/StbE
LAWTVEFDKDALNELQKLDKTTQRRILKYLRERIATDEDPRRFGRALRGTQSGFWRYRVGDYRIISAIQDDVVRVFVVRIGHRRNVYE